MTIHYHGTPITPRSELLKLAGHNFCVSFSDPRDVEVCHEIGQSVMLDNGAFSFWTRGRRPDWPAFVVWAEVWLEHRTTWAVMPDVIDGTEEDNERLSTWLFAHSREVWARCAPVWHMHESLDRWRYLTLAHDRVCIGSSGQFAVIGTDRWRRRMHAAFDAMYPHARPWVHMLRGMSLVGDEFPFASVDSTDVARNHSRPANTAAGMAVRWDGRQTPPRWRGSAPQLSIDLAMELA